MVPNAATKHATAAIFAARGPWNEELFRVLEGFPDLAHDDEVSSQKDGFTWDRMTKLANDWLPAPRILHPWPDQRFAVKHPR